MLRILIMTSKKKRKGKMLRSSKILRASRKRNPMAMALNDNLFHKRVIEDKRRKNLLKRQNKRQLLDS